MPDTIRDGAEQAGAVSVAQLRATVSGRVITPDDADYDRARTVMPGGIDRRPAVIVRAADAGDVARVVSLARDTGVDLAVRSGGHSVYGVCDGGVVLDLADLQAVEVDAEGRTAWAEAGLTAGAFTAALAKYGLAVGFGDTGSVGVGGITLGGGVGYLVRKHGLTIDSLLAAEVVTADGELVRADERQHPELFWALRGGGGNFGVVTRFQFRLHPVETVVGGMLLLPATPQTIAGFMAAAEAAPEELSAIANVMTAPPMPFLPAEHHGKLVVMALMCFAGDVEAGQRAMAPFRALATPLTDLVGPMPYAEIYGPAEEDYHPTAVAHTMYVDAVDEAVAETILAHLEASDAPLRVAQLRVLGGASARVPADATAYPHRDQRIMANLAAFFQGEQDRPVKQEWLDGFVAAMSQGYPGGYVNFLGTHQSIRDAYPGATWERLVAVKRRYDPTNLFRLNGNIAP